MPEKRLDDETQIPPFKVGRVEYRLTGCTEYIDTKPITKHGLMIFVDVTDSTTSYSQYCDVELKSDIGTASLAHFDGPLTIGPETSNYIPETLEIPAGGEPVDFRVHIGTVDKTTGCWTIVSAHDGAECRFTDDQRPLLTIDFPTADGKKIKRTYSLDDFC